MKISSKMKKTFNWAAIVRIYDCGGILVEYNL